MTTTTTTGTEVARLAEYLADDVILSLAPADGELDLPVAALAECGTTKETTT